MDFMIETLILSSDNPKKNSETEEGLVPISLDWWVFSVYKPFSQLISIVYFHTLKSTLTDLIKQ